MEQILRLLQALMLCPSGINISWPLRTYTISSSSQTDSVPIKSLSVILSDILVLYNEWNIKLLLLVQ